MFIVANCANSVYSYAEVYRYIYIQKHMPYMGPSPGKVYFSLSIYACILLCMYISIHNFNDANWPILDDRLIVKRMILAPIFLAIEEMETRDEVSPDPEPINRRSFSFNDGEVTSPTMFTLNPKCINRIAKHLIIKPVLPSPAMKIL